MSESELSNIDGVRVWARHVAAETYGSWTATYYVCPEGVAALAQELDAWSGIVAVLGSLGVGKTNALLALYWGKVPGMKGDREDRVLFKWREERELLDSFLHGELLQGGHEHELSSEFIQEYSGHLFGALESLPRRRKLSLDMDKYVKFADYRRAGRRSWTFSGHSLGRVTDRKNLREGTPSACMV